MIHLTNKLTGTLKATISILSKHPSSSEEQATTEDFDLRRLFSVSAETAA
jgi:hypothetical protein